jgi:hypothetical protein
LPIFHPFLEAHLEQVGIDRREHVAHRVVAGDTRHIREETAKEGLVLLTSERDFHEIIRPRDCRRQREQMDFPQRIQ